MAEVTALILAGGLSRRFGSDKAATPFRGEPMARRVVERALSAFPRVVAVSRFGGKHAFLGVPILRDLYEDAHPLGGILSAFRQDHAEAYCVLACDAPLVRPPLLRRLRELGERGESVFLKRDGRLEPLPCVLAREDAEALAPAPAPGAALPALRELPSLTGARVLSERELKRLDPEGMSFRDADTAEALAALEAHAL